MIDQLKKVSLLKLFNLQKFERQAIYFVVIILFIVVNLLLSSFSSRIDLSYGKAYTLADSTKKILHNLDDLVNIDFYASSDMPTKLIPLKNDVIDLLNEFKRVGGNKIAVKVLDPKKDQNAASDAKEAGLPQLQFSQLDQNKYAVTASYFGIVISYANKKDILSQVTDLSNLEYGLTSSIYKLTKKELAKVGVVGKEESFDPKTDDLASLKNLLSKQFDLSFLDISSGSKTKSIDNSYKSLLIFDTDSKEYDKNEIGMLKDYLNNGGKALFFIDGVWVSDNLTNSPSKSNLFSLLDNYGIKVENNLVLSTSSELVNFGGGQVSYLIEYPFWIKASDFSNKVSYFGNISELTYPWVSSLTLEKKSGVNSLSLVKTDNKSWDEKNNIVLDPQSITPPQNNDFKQYVIAAQATKNQSEVVVIPSSRFILERYLNGNSGNLEFIFNILNDLASGGALSGIRSRSVSFYPIPDLPENQKDIFRYLNILFLPGLFALLGGYKLLKRK